MQHKTRVSVAKRSTPAKRASAHPSYPNPTIAEALCEIHFALADGVAWQPTFPGDLFKVIQEEYPDMEPSVDVGLRLEVGPQGIGQSLVPFGPRMRFKHRSKPLMIQLAPLVFTVNVLPAYPGWQEMRDDVSNAWSQAKRVVKPAQVTRLGLRYINRIERHSERERVKDWFRAGDFIPSGVLEASGAFLSRVESQIDMHDRVIVTLAEVQQEAATATRAIVFDIDRIVEKQLSVNDEQLLPEMDRLHEHVWEIFDSSKGSRLTEHLGKPRI